MRITQDGDEIMTRSQDDPSAVLKVGRVTRIFRNMAPAILWLTLATGEVMGTTPGHEVWTYEDAWTHAGQLEVGDTFLGRDGLPVEVLDFYLDRTPTPVYNLEVDGTFTYFAEGVWVHNNSACDVDLNRLHHIFGKRGRNLDDLVAACGGDRAAAFLVVQDAVNALRRSDGVYGKGKEIPVVVKGIALEVRGKVKNGMIKIGTFFKAK